MAQKQSICFDNSSITIDNIIDLSENSLLAQLSTDQDFLSFIQRGADYVMQILAEGKPVYGINTGLGDSCDVVIVNHLALALSKQLVTYHGCGLGAYFSSNQAKAIIAVRIASLAKGYSGVRPILLQQLVAFLNHNITPLIPSEGSVGASGDLTPLSYLAASLCGEREVLYKGERMQAHKALNLAGLQCLVLQPKEALALMNGTSVMTALACEAYSRAHYLMQLATRITAMASFALDGNAHHFDEFLFSLKPHAGQQNIAQWIRQDLIIDDYAHSGRIQDRYSIRCAPHILGVLADALVWIKTDIENEINSVNDNPIIDAERRRVMHGGHFYGGHIAFTMDSLKNQVANIADMLDRQMALLVDSRYSNGLPNNLSGSCVANSSINHGLKALQISVSAWTAEALKLTMPASVFSRSTESHNQDKVSMGTIASRDCLRILELTEQVSAAMLIAVFQGVQLRLKLPKQACIHTNLANMVKMLSTHITFIEEDRALQPELEQLIIQIRLRAWPLYMSGESTESVS